MTKEDIIERLQDILDEIEIAEGDDKLPIGVDYARDEINELIDRLGDG